MHWNNPVPCAVDFSRRKNMLAMFLARNLVGYFLVIYSIPTVCYVMTLADFELFVCSSLTFFGAYSKKTQKSFFIWEICVAFQWENRFGGLKWFFYFHFAYLSNKFKNSKISLFQVAGNFYVHHWNLVQMSLRYSNFSSIPIIIRIVIEIERKTTNFGTYENEKRKEKHPKRAHCHLPTSDANNSLLWVTHISILNGPILIFLRNTICMCTLLSIQKKKDTIRSKSTTALGKLFSFILFSVVLFFLTFAVNKRIRRSFHLVRWHITFFVVARKFLFSLSSFEFGSTVHHFSPAHNAHRSNIHVTV